MRVARWLLLVGLCMALAPRAVGQPMNAEEASREFKAAQTLYQAKRCAEALPKLRRLVEGTSSPNAQLYVARCLRDTSQLPAAYNAYSEAIRSAADERYADTRSAAAAERVALESKVARIVIAAADPPDGLVVWLDDVELAAPRFGEPHAVARGRLRVRAEAPGRRPFERDFELTEGALQSVAIVLDPTRGARPAPPPERDAQPSSRGPDRTWAYVALGVGAAGVVTFGVAGTLASQRFDELRDKCGGACPESERDAIDGGRRLDTIANVGLVVGGLGLGTGLALLFFGGSGDSSHSAVVVAPARGGAAVELAGRF
ncbi:MAG: hypothetical protein KF718_13900 [Polyangiaceae bacterium]|nr:hypothetical protein [Polyangiaceae bacterium]